VAAGFRILSGGEDSCRLRTAFVPSFSLTQVELPLALVRGFFVAALFSAFGALVSVASYGPV
jgi:hypothetical protein